MILYQPQSICFKQNEYKMKWKCKAGWNFIKQLFDGNKTTKVWLWNCTLSVDQRCPHIYILKREKYYIRWCAVRKRSWQKEKVNVPLADWIYIDAIFATVFTFYSEHFYGQRNKFIIQQQNFYCLRKLNKKYRKGCVCIVRMSANILNSVTRVQIPAYFLFTFEEKTHFCEELYKRKCNDFVLQQ